MNCPRCSAWSSVLETRQRDGGHRVERRRECANGHTFATTEIHRPVWCSAKQRQRAFLATVFRRQAFAKRDAEIRRRVAAGETGAQVARAFGVSPSAVSLITNRED